MQHLLHPNRAYWNRGTYWDEGAYAIGALIRIGALINKNIRGGALIREGALIGTRVLNQIIAVCPLPYFDIYIHTNIFWLIKSDIKNK